MGDFFYLHGSEFLNFSTMTIYYYNEKNFKKLETILSKSVTFKGHLWKKKPDLVEQYDKNLKSSM